MMEPSNKLDQMAALDSLLADPGAGGPPPMAGPQPVMCQVCQTAIDPTTGAPVEDPLAASAGAPLPGLDAGGPTF